MNFSEKIINELPHQPPAIRSGKLDRLVERLKLTIPLDTAEQIQKPRKAFLIDFKQPMSDYIAFKVTSSLHFWKRHKSRNDLITSRQKMWITSCYIKWYFRRNSPQTWLHWKISSVVIDQSWVQSRCVYTLLYLSVYDKNNRLTNFKF